MGVVTAGLAVLSVVSSHLKRKKAKKAAARRRDASLGQEIRAGNSARPIPVIYGYTATNGIPVWAGTANNFNTSTHVGTLPRSGRLTSTTNEGSRNEFLAQQHVVSLGHGLEITEMWSDEQRPTARYITNSSWGQVGADNTSSAAASHFLADRGTAKFQDITYVTTVHKLNREEPQYSGPPVPLFFCKGKTVQGISRAGSAGSYTYSLTTATFTTNAILILLDYLIGNYGPRWTWSADIDQEAFYNAAQIAAEVVQSETGLAGTVFSGASAYPYAYLGSAGAWLGAGAGTYGNSYISKGLSNKTGLQDKKGNYTASETQRDILRYEFNGAISTDSDWQDNITRIMDVIPGGEIYRTVKGRWKVVVPNSMDSEANQSVGTVGEDDLISPVQVTYPDTTERLNQLDIEFSNINKDFSTDTVTFPEFSTDPLSLYQNLRSQDRSRRLGNKVVTPGIADEFHANSWASNTIHISRRAFYTFTTRPSGFLYEPGDVVRLVDSLSGIDNYVRVSETRVREDLSVEITGIQFYKDDYGWDPASFGTVVDQVDPSTSILPPSSVSAKFNTIAHEVDVTWTPNTDEDITVDSYVVERQDSGDTTWKTAAEVAHGVNKANTSIGLGVKTVKFRVRSKTSQNGLSSPSAETSDLTVGELTASNLTGQVTKLESSAPVQDVLYTSRGSMGLNLPMISGEGLGYTPVIDVTSTLILEALPAGNGMSVFLQRRAGQQTVPQVITLGVPTESYPWRFIPYFGGVDANMAFGVISESVNAGDRIVTGSTTYLISNINRTPTSTLVYVTNTDGTSVTRAPARTTYRTVASQVTGFTWSDMAVVHLSARASTSGSYIVHLPFHLAGALSTRQTAALATRLLFVPRGTPGSAPLTTKTNITSRYGVYGTSFVAVKTR